MADLTDDELRKLLEAFGEDVGPINDETRSLWKKRLLKLKSSRIPRKVEKPHHLKVSPSETNIEKLFDSPQREKGACNRNDPVDRIKMSSPNFSVGSGSSFELDYSPMTGEPGNSPYPFRAKPHATSPEKRMDRRMLDIESLNLETYRNPENYRNIENNENYKNYRNFQNYFNFKKYCELKDKGKILYRFPTVYGEQVCEIETMSKEPADFEDEWSDSEEDYFLADNLIIAGRGTLQTIGLFSSYLIKGLLVVIIVSLCLNTDFLRQVSRGRIG